MKIVVAVGKQTIGIDLLLGDSTLYRTVRSCAGNVIVDFLDPVILSQRDLREA